MVEAMKYNVDIASRYSSLELPGSSAHRPYAASTNLAQSMGLWAHGIMALINGMRVQCGVRAQACAGGIAGSNSFTAGTIWQCMFTPTGVVQAPTNYFELGVCYLQ